MTSDLVGPGVVRLNKIEQFGSPFQSVKWDGIDRADCEIMSSGSIVKTVGVPELQEWLVSLGLLDISEEERRGSEAGDGCDVGASVGAIREKLRDGVVLCHLVNKIKPGSVDKVIVHY